jgi:short-subunit dehydrogenase
VTTIFPGFVRTPLLDNLLAITGAQVPRGLIEVDGAARRIAHAIDAGYRIYCFPWTTTWLALTRIKPKVGLVLDSKERGFLARGIFFFIKNF